MAALGILICGNTEAPSVANDTLDHLSKSINRFAGKAITYLNGEFSEEAESFGAFCARVVLENACAALVGRLDPFRLLYLAEFQAQGGFKYGFRYKSGFQWTGDVLSEQQPNNEMWNSDHPISKISRALFSQYSDYVYWRQAVEKALDFTKNSSLQELRELDPETFTNALKGKCSTLYSTLSKGVHWDFFYSSIVMDEVTVKDAIRDCLLALGNLGLVSHFVPTAYRSLEHKNALDTYHKFRTSFQ